jgi:hypothetical protein
MNRRTLVLILFLGNLLFTVNLTAQTLHLYGGHNYRVYLGCLNCNEYDSNSVWNQYGNYGNKYSSISIWNKYGDYGGEYSSYSPWNAYASYPPAIVDSKGDFYGYLTVNSYESKRADFQLALTMYEFHEFICDDVSKWYEKIFE